MNIKFGYFFISFFILIGTKVKTPKSNFFKKNDTKYVQPKVNISFTTNFNPSARGTKVKTPKSNFFKKNDTKYVQPKANISFTTNINPSARNTGSIERSKIP